MNSLTPTTVEARIALVLGVLSFATSSMQISESNRINASLTLLATGIYTTVVWEGSIVTTIFAAGAVREFLRLARAAWGA